MKNPKKALKISLLVFIALMLLNGLLCALTGSLFLAVLIPAIAFCQFIIVNKKATLKMQELAEADAEALLKSLGGLTDEKHD